MFFLCTGQFRDFVFFILVERSGMYLFYYTYASVDFSYTFTMLFSQN